MDPVLEQKLSVAQGALDAVKDYARSLVPLPAPVPVLPVVLGFPNAPMNIPTISDQPFTIDTDPRGWAASGQWALVSDASAPVSPSKVLRFTYPNGFAGGSAPGNIYIGLGGKRAMYAGFYFKTNAGWQGHNSNVNKLAHIFAQNERGEMYLCFYGSPGGEYRLRVATQFTNGEQRWRDPNTPNSSLVAMGAWNLAEWFVDYATSTLRFWLNGKIIGDHRDVTFPVSGPLAEFQFSPTWGGVGDQKRQADTLDIDHALVKAA